MKTIKFIFLAALGAMLTASTESFAAFSSKSAGTSGAAFLKIGAGARPTAIGEAFVAVADDANTLFYNAAGLATIRKKNEFVAMRAELFQDLSYTMFSFAHPLHDWGTIGVGIQNLNISDIEQRSGDSEIPDAKFSSNDTAYSFGYGQKLTIWGLPGTDEERGLYLGADLKIIRQTLAGYQANSFGTDVGALYKLRDWPAQLGFSVLNMGSQSKFKTVGDPLPLTLKYGASMRFGQEWAFSGIHGTNKEPVGLLSSLELHMPRDNDPSLRGGLEFTTGWSKELRTHTRGGYQTGRARQIDGTLSGISLGAGLDYKFFNFDFAWMPFGDLGNTYRYSVKLKF